MSNICLSHQPSNPDSGINKTVLYIADAWVVMPRYMVCRQVQVFRRIKLSPTSGSNVLSDGCSTLLRNNNHLANYNASHLEYHNINTHCSENIKFQFNVTGADRPLVY
jgi:hypothetical protein